MAISGWTIRCVLDQSLVTVYNRGRSFTFSNDRLFSLNLTFPDLSQYPHIFHIFYEFLLNKSTDLSCISSLFMSTAIFTGWVLLVDSKCRNTVILTGSANTLSRKVFLN